MSVRGNGAAGSGLLGWICGLLGSRGIVRDERQMEVLETLVLGPRKQVMLLRVGSGRYLVGTGADSVDTIVRVDDAARGGVSA